MSRFQCTFKNLNGFNFTHNVIYDVINATQKSMVPAMHIATNTVHTTPATDLEPHPTANILATIEGILWTKVILIVCLFGIIGNILNLFVLTRRTLRDGLERMEISVNLGLIALAVSDMLFCAVALPRAFVHTATNRHSTTFEIIYNAHGHAIINIFVLSSTLLIVNMALSRYVGICHPLKARQIVGMRFAKITICCVFVASIFLNLPRFWVHRIISKECLEGYYVHIILSGYLRQKETLWRAYLWLYFIIGILMPFITLAFCNSYLVRALRESTKLRRQYSRGPKDRCCPDSKNIITLTLTCIMIFYFILVVPADIINYLRDFTNHKVLGIIVAIANTLQAINFSFNFVLYCIINAQFRKIMKDLISCSMFKPVPINRFDSIGGATTAPTAHTRV